MSTVPSPLFSHPHPPAPFRVLRALGLQVWSKFLLFCDHRGGRSRACFCFTRTLLFLIFSFITTRLPATPLQLGLGGMLIRSSPSLSFLLGRKCRRFISTQGKRVSPPFFFLRLWPFPPIPSRSMSPPALFSLQYIHRLYDRNHILFSRFSAFLISF